MHNGKVCWSFEGTNLFWGSVAARNSRILSPLGRPLSNPMGSFACLALVGEGYYTGQESGSVGVSGTTFQHRRHITVGFSLWEPC